jgi:hypothetical protein
MRVGVALLAAGILGTLVWFFQAWDPLKDGAALCASEYQGARTALDTAIIDQRKPVNHPEDALSPLQCGELRRAGRLR